VVGVNPNPPDRDERSLEEPGKFQVHGTTIALHFGAAINDPVAVATFWVAALIRGPSGSGKSDLALRCLAQPLDRLFPLSAQQHGARLVADDRTDLTVMTTTKPVAVNVPSNRAVTASAPGAIAGLLEVRGLGIVAVPQVPQARLILVVDLATPDQVPRYPDHATVAIGPEGSVTVLPRMLIAPFEVASPLKLLLALLRTARSGSPVGADATKHHYLPEGQ
jgi:HPr kinase/phosphorylase